ncbi:MAG: NYN domain-containing protein [Chloroflexota bacterium]
MGKNVAVFVDVANIFYAAKAAGVDIDYVTLLKSASAGRDLVRAYAYTGLDPDNENQRNFHSFLARNGYKVVSKDIRKYGDGKVKANLDIELVVDMMKTARNLDIAIVVSGDGDFAPAIRAVQETGVRVEVISFRGNTSSDLIEVADLFTDITQLAKVEKGSRSGRRVAEDEQDLSMTEVPDKQTEGTGRGRARGRGRDRGTEREPVAAAARGRGRGRTPAPVEAVSADGSTTGLVALPGERLSRAGGGLSDADLATAEVFTEEGTIEPAVAAIEDREGLDGGDAGRRRRRRGGRGRGRGRGGRPEGEAVTGSLGVPVMDENEEIEEEEPLPAPSRGPRRTPFGSVWDSQLGTPTAPVRGVADVPEDEDLDEPEIPEYLIAEQRRSNDRGRGRGPRGGRSAYQSAMERERYGRGGAGGINRYPDVSARPPTQNPAARPNQERPYERPARRGPTPVPQQPSSSAEPWSEVPPELEELLRNQVAARSASPAVTPQAPTFENGRADESEARVADAAPKRRTTRRATAGGDEAAVTAKATSPKATSAKKSSTKPASSRSRSTKTTTTETADAPAEAATPKRRTTRKPATGTAESAAAPRSRTRKASAAAEPGETEASPEIA